MAARNRSQASTTPKGVAHWQNGGSAPWSFIGNNYPVVTSYDNVDDEVHEGDNTFFSTESYQLSGGTINGLQPDSTIWNAYIADFYSHPEYYGPIILSGSPDDFAAATMGAARSNPSGPLSDIPANLGQMGDAVEGLYLLGADLLRHHREGRHFTFFGDGRGASRTGGGYLNYQFNWAPLINDLRKLWHLRDNVSRRVKQIQQLHTDRGLRRTVEVWSGSDTYHADSIPVQTNFGYFAVPMDVITTQKVKVHCRWLPGTFSFPWDDHPDDMQLALRALTGDTLDYSFLWQITPWSWLIDWAGNVGDYLKATRNTVGAILNSCSVMRHTRTEWRFPGAQGAGSAYLEPCLVTKETKTRRPAAVIPEATIPFLDSGSMAIADALLTSRLF